MEDTIVCESSADSLPEMSEWDFMNSVPDLPSDIDLQLEEPWSKATTKVIVRRFLVSGEGGKGHDQALMTHWKVTLEIASGVTTWVNQ